MKPGPVPVLLFVSSALWLLAAGCAPHHNSEDPPLIAAAVLLPALTGAVLARYPWPGGASTPASLPRRALFVVLMIAGALWVMFTTLFLGFFFLITFTTGWE
jgi:hypothetical protein